MKIQRTAAYAKRVSVQTDRGFTVLMAVLIAILVLAIASSLVRIVLKQVRFSGSGRESQISYYVADTGIECAFLWDFRTPELFTDPDGNGVEAFPEPEQTDPDGAQFTPTTISDLSNPTYSDAVAAMTCGEYSIVENSSSELKDFSGTTDDYVWQNVTGTSPDGFQTVGREFRFVLDADGKSYCGIVRVDKWYDDTLNPPRVRTMIDSRGYNNCSGNSATRYERGLRADY